MLNLSTWIPCTSSEGPGKRFALWVQGCAIRCPACCNPEMFAFVERHLKPIDEVLAMILEARDAHQIEGITILGGEPTAQAEGLAQLAQSVRQEGLSVMLFSGHTLEELHAQASDGITALLDACDLLVDGRYEQELHTDDRRWIGSTNQEVHFLTERYSPEDEAWEKANTVEITFDGKELLISGFPHLREHMKEWQRVLRRREMDKNSKKV